MLEDPSNWDCDRKISATSSISAERFTADAFVRIDQTRSGHAQEKIVTALVAIRQSVAAHGFDQTSLATTLSRDRRGARNEFIQRTTNSIRDTAAPALRSSADSEFASIPSTSLAPSNQPRSVRCSRRFWSRPPDSRSTPFRLARWAQTDQVIVSAIVKIGRYMAIKIVPIEPPMKTIMIGSSMAVRPATAPSTSSS